MRRRPDVRAKKNGSHTAEKEPRAGARADACADAMRLCPWILQAPTPCRPQSVPRINSARASRGVKSYRTGCPPPTFMFISKDEAPTNQTKRKHKRKRAGRGPPAPRARVRLSVVGVPTVNEVYTARRHPRDARRDRTRWYSRTGQRFPPLGSNSPHHGRTARSLLASALCSRWTKEHVNGN